MTSTSTSPAFLVCTNSNSSILSEPETDEPIIEALRRKLAAVSLELRNTKLDLMDARDNLESCQADLDAATSSLKEKELELQNTKDALHNSQQARRADKRNQVVPRSYKLEEVFVVLRFQQSQSLPVGGYRLFTWQGMAVDRALRQFFADHSDLDASEVEELRFDRSPRGENVYQ
ncbi:hypothetical protein BGX26_006287, partial [Mortierella sp. AD094]